MLVSFRMRSIGADVVNTHMVSTRRSPEKYILRFTIILMTNFRHHTCHLDHTTNLIRINDSSLIYKYYNPYIQLVAKVLWLQRHQAIRLLKRRPTIYCGRDGGECGAENGALGASVAFIVPSVPTVTS